MIGMPEADLKGLVASIEASDAAAGLPAFQFKTIPQGAATSVWAAIVADAEAVGGHYCEDCHVAEIVDGAGLRGGVRPYAVDPERAKALWAKSEAMVGERFLGGWWYALRSFRSFKQLSSPLMTGVSISLYRSTACEVDVRPGEAQ